ncbi:unnamed protein product [Camellia sinensis]
MRELLVWSEIVRFFGSASFHTFLSASPPTSFSDSTLDLDIESIGSFYHEKSITLGSLLGLILFKVYQRHYRLKSMEATAECTLPPLVCCIKAFCPAHVNSYSKSSGSLLHWSKSIMDFHIPLENSRSKNRCE